MGHGTSLMAPSNRRNAMTSPLRMRPVQRAGFEMSFAAVSEKIVIVGSVRDCWRSTQGRTAKMEFDNDAKIFCRVGKGALVPCPPCVTRVLLEMVGTLRFAHPTDWRLLSLLHSLRATRLAVTHQSIEM